jgi:hypothetical protein
VGHAWQASKWAGPTPRQPSPTIARVRCRGQPIELLPRDPTILESQVQLLLGYRLPFEVVGAAGNQRLRVMPPGYGGEGGAQPRAAVEMGS